MSRRLANKASASPGKTAWRNSARTGVVPIASLIRSGRPVRIFHFQSRELIAAALRPTRALPSIMRMTKRLRRVDRVREPHKNWHWKKALPPYTLETENR